MSKSTKNVENLCSVYNFKYLLLNEKLKEKNVSNSRNSIHQNSTNKYNLFKQMSFNNNNSNRIERNHSSINIAQLKKFSKFKINKNERKSMGKHSTSKLLIILKNSEKTKIKKKESITDVCKKTEIESEIKKKARFDNFGNLIDKKNKKKVHIAFVDELISEKSITEEIHIKSFKHLNIIQGLPKDDVYNPINNFNKCCFIY